MDFILLGMVVKQPQFPITYWSTSLRVPNQWPCIVNLLGVACEQHMEDYMTYKARKKDWKRTGEKSHQICVDVGCEGEIECGEGQRSQEESSGKLAPNLEKKDQKSMGTIRKIFNQTNNQAHWYFSSFLCN